MPNSSRTIVFIVGDRFAGFRAGKGNVILFSEYIDRLGGKVACSCERHYYIPAQGLSEQELHLLMATLPPANLEILLKSCNLPLAKSRLTHKRRRENVIISRPYQISSQDFVAQLALDDECAEMSDHTTGEHLQGMVLIEAARQIFIAVTEEYCLPPPLAEDSYFVINSFDTKFNAFAFPLPTQITYTVCSQSKTARGSSFTAAIGFLQAGLNVCEVTVQFSVYDATYLGPKENAKAQASVARATAQTKPDMLELGSVATA